MFLIEIEIHCLNRNTPVIQHDYTTTVLHYYTTTQND